MFCPINYSKVSTWSHFIAFSRLQWCTALRNYFYLLSKERHTVLNLKPSIWSTVNARFLAIKLFGWWLQDNEFSSRRCIVPLRNTLYFTVVVQSTQLVRLICTWFSRSRHCYTLVTLILSENDVKCPRVCWVLSHERVNFKGKLKRWWHQQGSSS